MTKQNKSDLKILFISKSYPPTQGGIEDQNYNLYQYLSKITSIKLIANTKGKRNFLPFVFYLFIKLPFILHKYKVVLFGDGTLAPIGEFFKLFYHKQKFVSVIHALDLTFAYKNSPMGKIYKFLNIPALKNFDKLIMVGNYAIEEAIRLGIDKNKCTFIPNGVNIKKVYEKHTREELEKLLSNTTKKDIDYYKNKKIILRVGRFVPHKGLHWFIDRVMPILPNDFILVGAGGYNPRTVGDSENYTLCKKYIKKHSFEDRVILFPNIEQEEMNILFNTADIYISPNIKIKGSAEGFGLNALEAVVCDRIVLSSNLQGLKDAIKDGVNGFLLEPENELMWKNKILEITSTNFDKNKFTKKAKEYTLQHFTWDKISAHYLETLKSLFH